jgi:hypothetical protein
VAESIGQGWDQHVVWYNGAQQARLIEAVVPRPAVWAALSVLAAAGLGCALAFRRWRRASGRGRDRAGEGLRPEAELALGLYAELEAAMAACGRPRAPGTPPLRHAEAIAAAGDVLGPEILDLTRTYLAVRFGGAGLSDEERGAFERRVRRLAAAGVTSR